MFRSIVHNVDKGIFLSRNDYLPAIAYNKDFLDKTVKIYQIRYAFILFFVNMRLYITKLSLSCVTDSLCTAFDLYKLEE